MGVSLREGYRRARRLLGELPLHSRGLRSKLFLRDVQEGSIRRLSANHGPAKTASCVSNLGSPSLSSEATPDVHAAYIRAPMWSFYKASDSISIKSSQQQRNLFTGGERKVSSWTGWRSFSSLQDDHVSTSDSSSTIGSTEAKASSLSAESDEDFDFRNFPALTSSYYENFERPSEMQVRKKRVTQQDKLKSSNLYKKLTADSIPKPRGRTYDFGIESRDIKPPPLEAGSRPQGGFDIDISFSDCEEDACEGSPSSH